MKKQSVSTLVKQAMTTAAKLKKIGAELANSRSYVEYTTAEWHKLPEAIREAQAELQARADESTMANAQLSKPLMNYSYNERYSRHYGSGPRNYASPVAQAAWEAERREKWARERLEKLESDARMTLDEFTKDDRELLDARQGQFDILQAILTNTLENISKIMGKPYTLENLATIPLTSKSKDAPAEWVIPAVQNGDVYRVQAVNLAKIAGKELSFKGVMFYAKQISEWAKLEVGNILEITYDDMREVLNVKSPTSRAAFKSQGDRPAPALVFATA